MSRGAVASGEATPAYDHPADLSADGVLYERLGVGQDGTAFYAADGGRPVLLTSVGVDGQQGSVERVAPAAMADLLEGVEWREAEEALLARAGGGGRD